MFYILRGFIKNYKNGVTIKMKKDYESYRIHNDDEFIFFKHHYYGMKFNLKKINWFILSNDWCIAVSYSYKEDVRYYVYNEESLKDFLILKVLKGEIETSPIPEYNILPHKIFETLTKYYGADSDTRNRDC